MEINKNNKNTKIPVYLIKISAIFTARPEILWLWLFFNCRPRKVKKVAFSICDNWGGGKQKTFVDKFFFQNFFD